MPSKTKSLSRCKWCPAEDSLYIQYHDEEWGVPLKDGQKLFEMLNLEGAQAGLSWKTILYKRENYRQVFDQFNPVKLARWNQAKIEKALLNSSIVRNRLKVAGVVKNAKAFLAAFDGDFDSFSKYLWDFVDGKPIVRSPFEMIARNEISDEMAIKLKKLGFTFVGSTICYAFMQAVGMVNDHAPDCFRYRPLATQSSN